MTRRFTVAASAFRALTIVREPLLSACAVIGICDPNSAGSIRDTLLVFR